MLKRASKSALGISLGTTIGMVMIPRIMDPNLNKIYPPIFVQTVVQFVASYIVAFLIFLLLDYFKLKKKRNIRIIFKGAIWEKKRLDT